MQDRSPGQAEREAMAAINSILWGSDDFHGIQQFYVAWQSRARRAVAFMGKSMLKEMLLEQMSRSATLSSM
eukprot:15258287-Alexandrium_andersonii.AAC.1